ncbi:MAG: BrxA/BrxB family bacilliredoxin [bacterium]
MQFPISQQPTYDPEAVQPMRDELIAVGFQELLTPEDVDRVLDDKNEETVLVMINSVCGCAAGSARPGVTLALQHHIIPDRLATVFAGQDKAAAANLRQQYLNKFPPSSPLVALMKNGKVVFILHRHDIEGRSPQEIANRLTIVFEQECSRNGPSISPDEYAKLVHAVACGSKIPKFADN